MRSTRRLIGVVTAVVLATGIASRGTSGRTPSSPSVATTEDDSGQGVTDRRRVVFAAAPLGRCPSRERVAHVCAYQ